MTVDLRSAARHAAPHGTSPGAGARRSLDAALAVLTAGAVLQALVRLVHVPGRDGPVVIADEIGYLVNARILAGGPGGT